MAGTGQVHPVLCYRRQGGARTLVKTCRQLRPVGFKERRIVLNSCWPGPRQVAGIYKPSGL